MITLWKTRLRQHQKRQLKYLRLIFNDQFVIALIFLIGSIGFWYSNFLKTFNTAKWWAKPVVIVLLLAISSIGHLATLLQKPDGIFLLPKENQLQDYLLKARNYSLSLPLSSIIILGFIIYPFAYTAAGIDTNEYISLLISVLLFKIVLIDAEFYELYDFNNVKLKVYTVILMVLLLAVYTWAYLAAIISIIVLLIDNIKFKKSVINKNLNWPLAINKEDERSFNIKRFYNLFTDVPGMSAKIKRRKYLDFIANSFKRDHEHTFSFIFIRGFLRNNEYIGLYCRLILLEFLILLFVNNFYLSLIIFALFLYLVAFQLKPFFKQYSGNIMQKIYPISINKKITDFNTVVLAILLVQWLICSLPVIFIYQFSLSTFIILLVGIAVILIYTRILKSQLKKL